MEHGRQDSHHRRTDDLSRREKNTNNVSAHLEKFDIHHELWYDHYMATRKLTYTTKSGVVQYMPRMKWLTSIVEGDNNEGFCLACGSTQDCVEPDARKYVCEACKAPKVYGAEELLMMGFGR